MSRVLVAIPLLILAACAPDRPDLEDRFSAEARAQAVPQLQPLAPLLESGTEGFPESAAVADDLSARAEDLRRRAARLRAMTQ